MISGTLLKKPNKIKIPPDVGPSEGVCYLQT
nr:MAG TPA: hypothetical protein [Caudoviricetes sp.]